MGYFHQSEVKILGYPIDFKTSNAHRFLDGIFILITVARFTYTFFIGFNFGVWYVTWASGRDFVSSFPKGPPISVILALIFNFRGHKFSNIVKNVYYALIEDGFVPSGHLGFQLHKGSPCPCLRNFGKLRHSIRMKISDDWLWPFEMRCTTITNIGLKNRFWLKDKELWKIFPIYVKLCD